MSKMSELDFLVQELKKCGESLVNIADELTGIFSETGEKKEEASAESAKEYTFTEVRAFLAEKSRAGHTAEIRKTGPALTRSRVPTATNSARIWWRSHWGKM